MAALSIQKTIPAGSVAQSATYNSDGFEVTNHRLVSCQINKSGAGKGSAKLQWSNDGSNWADLNTTASPGATKSVIAADTAIHLYGEIPGGHVRAVFVEDGTGTVTISGGRWIAKQN